MKVFDILTESQDTSVQEGPLRYAKRTLFKNTQMGKTAQVSAEIDSEAKKFYKEFMSDVRNFNDPRPTAQNLGKWMTGKKFISSPSQVIKLLRKNPTFMNKVDAVGKGISKGAKAGAKAVSGAAKKSADLAVGAAKKVKAKLSPEPSKIDPRQGELDLQSMYNESVLIRELETKGMSIELSKDEVMNVMRGFMKQGREKMVSKGAGGVQSAYADADDDNNSSSKDDSKSSSKSDDNTSKSDNKQIASAISLLKNAGYTVSKK